MAGNPRADRYSHTPRKVFDSYIDRMAVKRQRDREDNRNDYQLLLKLIQQLREDHEHLKTHVEAHCNTLALDDDPSHSDQVREEL